MAKAVTKNQGRAATRNDEFSAKVKKIRAYLRQHGLGGVLLSTQALFAWATGGRDNHVVLGSDNGFAQLLVTPEEVVVLATTIEMPRLLEEEFADTKGLRIQLTAYPWFKDGALDHELQKILQGRVFASDSGLGARLTDDFIAMTFALTPTEVERYRVLGRDCSLAMEEALAEVKPGDTEHHLAGLICARMWDHSVRPQLSLVASDERAYKFRHPIPQNKKIKKHILAVLCGKRGGLITNVTRMLHFGRKLPDDLRRKHDAVCSVDMAFNAATRVGVPLKDVFAAGIAEYEAQGFAQEWKLHHQGGPTGYQGRSYLGRPTEDRPVLEQQAFAWNPSIAGTKSEDTILVTASGPEFLSAPTRRWPAVEVKRNGKTYRRADIFLR
ncbi:MAG TPA: M24 family metallopeptidase [Planctomycetota bacterium]|nr:M24 family metallopeptidase [Planctomycetota bacterium]